MKIELKEVKIILLAVENLYSQKAIDVEVSWDLIELRDLFVEEDKKIKEVQKKIIDKYEATPDEEGKVIFKTDKDELKATKEYNELLDKEIDIEAPKTFKLSEFKGCKGITAELDVLKKHKLITK